MSKKKTYESSLDELRDILEKLQSEDISIDQLGKNIKKAQELIQVCRGKLRTIEEEVDSIRKAN